MYRRYKCEVRNNRTALDGFKDSCVYDPEVENEEIY